MTRRSAALLQNPRGLMSCVAVLERRPGKVDGALSRGLAGAVRAEEPGDGPGRDPEAEGVHGGGVAVALGELACLDHDRTFLGDRVGRSAQQRTLRQVTGTAGRASEGWSGAGRAVTPAAACGVARCRGWLPGSPAMRCGVARSRRSAG